METIRIKWKYQKDGEAVTEMKNVFNSLLVFYCYHDNTAHITSLKTLETYSLQALEAGNSELRCRQGLAFLGVQKENLLHDSLLVSFGCWQFLVFFGLWNHNSSLSIVTQCSSRVSSVSSSDIPFSLSVSLLLHISTQVILDERPKLLQYGLILITFITTPFPNQVTLGGSGRTQICEEDTIQPNIETGDSAQSKKESVDQWVSWQQTFLQLKHEEMR